MDHFGARAPQLALGQIELGWAPPSVGHHARGARHSDLSRERSSQQGCPTHGEQIFASAPSQPLAGGALTRSSLICADPLDTIRYIRYFRYVRYTLDTLGNGDTFSLLAAPARPGLSFDVGGKGGASSKPEAAR